MSTPNPAPILTITLNPALDFATSVPRIVADEKLYCRPPRVDPGGGGVNVARTIGRLGGQATALVVAGGPTGARLMDLLEREGVAAQAFQTQADTRFSFAVTDEHTGAQQRFSLPGEPISEEEAQALLSTVESAIPQGAYVVLSGGVAPGLADDVPQQIQSRIAAKAARLVVDTSKAPLQHLIEAPRAPVHVLRVDRKEAAQAAQNPLIRLEDCIAFAASLVARGVAHHVVTGRGADGSVLVSRDMQVLCRAPQVAVRSKIGAGDAFVGALVLALARGEAPDQALRWGVAAASATVGTEGTALCDVETVRALLPQCTLDRV